MFKIGDIVMPKERAPYLITSRENKWIGEVLGIENALNLIKMKTISCKEIKYIEHKFIENADDFEYLNEGGGYFES